MTALPLLPQNPTLVETREALLLADSALNGGLNHIPIWNAFARRGMGLYASSTWPPAQPFVEEYEALTVSPSFFAPNPTASVDTIGLYDPVYSQFYLRNTNSQGTADFAFGFGAPGAGWIPLAGDWNNDGRDTIGLYAPNTSMFYFRNTNSTGPTDMAYGFGAPGAGWLPIAGDWNHDGIVTVGLYNPATSIFYLRNSHTAGPADVTFAFGSANGGYKPLGGDWNGDGFASGGLYLSTYGQFYLRNAQTPGVADQAFGFGGTGLPTVWRGLAGDWDADSLVSAGVYNNPTSTFYLRQHDRGTSSLTVPFGAPGAGWLPIVGDWDGPTGYPLRLEATTQPESQEVAALCQTDVDMLVTAAIASWQAMGAGPAALERMARVEVVIRDLPEGYLGLATPGLIELDMNGSGRGWFIDPTPQADDEFRPRDEHLVATDPKTAGLVDALTVIEHELGHAVGLKDLDGMADSLMAGTLSPGVRRKIGRAEIEAVLTTNGLS